MRTVTLSDFVGDRIREAQRERAERYEFDRRAYELGAPKRRVKFIAAFGVYALVVIGAILWRPLAWGAGQCAWHWGGILGGIVGRGWALHPHSRDHCVETG